MAKIVFKLSSTVGESLEFHQFEIARIGFKLPTMVGENLEFH